MAVDVPVHVDVDVVVDADVDVDVDVDVDFDVDVGNVTKLFKVVLEMFKVVPNSSM